MAWRRIGDKPLYEPMQTRFTHIYAALGGDELTLCFSFEDQINGLVQDCNISSMLANGDTAVLH